MERVILDVTKRETSGKGYARSLRREGKLPAVVYKGQESTPLEVDYKKLLKLLRTAGDEQVIFNLKFADGGSKLAIIKDWQKHPITGRLMHTDFIEVSMTEQMRTSVKIITEGEAIGVKRDQGILEQPLRELEIECLPEKMPGHIEVDISELETGSSIHVSDLELGEGVTVITDPSEVIVSVSLPILEEEAPAEEAEEEEGAEPEVTGKGKAEEEEEEEGKESGE